MSWQQVLSGKWDTEESESLAQEIVSDPALFEQVFAAFMTKDGELTHRAGHILNRVFRRHNEMLLPKIPQLIEGTENPPHQWYNWMVLSYMKGYRFPPEYDGAMADIAFKELGKSYSKPAVKNSCMNILEYVCKRNPELIPEFRLYLEEILTFERRSLVHKAKKQLNYFKKWK